MKNIFILTCLLLSFTISAQTVEQPVLIEVKPIISSLSAGSQSALIVTFQIPKGVWLGAEGSSARVPPATIIRPIQNDYVTFDKPQFPEPFVEGVPAKLGLTKVYKEVLKVVIPYTVKDQTPEGELPLSVKITYTPGYNAGRLSTHVNEKYSTTVEINSEASNNESIPQPANGKVSDDFTVAPKNYENVSRPFRFMFKPMEEDKGLTKTLHKIWLDPDNHGKMVRFMPFPFASVTRNEGASAGMGASFMNSTREGTMTGMFAPFMYYNEYTGLGGGIQAVSCPAAYHNYQMVAFLGSDSYRFIEFHYENLTIGKNDNFGTEITVNSYNEPRRRFFGLGAESVEEDEVAYRGEEFEGLLDFYALPLQNVRIGLGLRYRDMNTHEPLDALVDEGIASLFETDRYSNLLGKDGASVFGTRFNFVFDHRDQEFSPSKGFYGKTTIEYNSLLNNETLPELADNYWTFSLDMRQYFSAANQKLVFLLRNSWTFNSEENLPFFEMANVGGLNSLRAYDVNRFLGKNAFFASMEMRYTLFEWKILGYPMSIEMAGFLDAGQVFGAMDELGDELNVDPGISLRMINRPNVGIILNASKGKDGMYYSGGIGLPF